MQKNNYNKPDVVYSKQKKVIRNHQRKFSQQEVTFEDTPLFFPKGLEKIFLFIYFVSLPYLTGLGLLFFYIGNGSLSLFASLNTDASYILTWIIGYEFLAILTLLWILKKAIEFTMNSSSSQHSTKDFRRP